MAKPAIISVRTAARAVLGVALIAVAWSGAAELAYRASFSAGQGLDSREASARFAQHMVACSTRYRVRAGWLEGQQLLDEGDYNRAVTILAAAYKLDVADDGRGDPALLAVFRQAQAVQARETVRKAHLQHGHEGPGGTLTPDDVER